MDKLIVLKQMLKDFYPFAFKRLGIDKTVKVKFLRNERNAKNPLGKTAYYEPDKFCISVYTFNRHPKDILRSISHELVHHKQNCDGKFDETGPTTANYAQEDETLRDLEKDAYLNGNIIFRDWEDQYKNQETENEPIGAPMNVYPTAGPQYKGLKGDNLMEQHFKKRNTKINQALMDRWGYKQPVSEGRWANDVVRPTNDQRNSLGGKLTFTLNNTPGARAIQKGFDLASANEPAVWGDEDNIRKIQDRSQDIEDTYYEYNQLLQQLTQAEKKYPEIGAVNYYTQELKSHEDGPEGYRTLTFIELALQKVVEELKNKGKAEAAKIVNQASEKVMTLNNNLRNTLGYEASR